MSQPKTNRFFIALAFAYLLASLCTTYFMIGFAQSYQQHKTKYTETLNFQERLLNAREWMFASEWEPKKAQAAATFKEAQADFLRAQRWGYLGAALAVIFIILVVVFFYRHPLFYQKLSFTFIVIALGCLATGIFAPMLEIEAFSQDLTIPLKTHVNLGITKVKVDLSKTFDGRMYFYYQNKSIVELIKLLFQKKSFLVGGAIVAFSVLIPLFKLLFSILLLSSGWVRHTTWVQQLVSSIGKWSMADVFVAAIFLAYLSFQHMNAGIDTESNLLWGAYFFLAYCVFSISSTYFINHSIKKELF
ncbi:paraquat-inducible protein A [uncultured Microscilla sp.]|uniref:paraquat-inducible protein A n=1 Tax=uncultured Microscilla sp. TaxID=432653 RepID=UPI0026321C81|nr:paraquat-inducible protein A [uncultured Microscilla sp.]